MTTKQGLSAVTASVGLAVALALLGAVPAAAKDKVKVAFIGPLTGGVAANGIGGRNSADLAVRLRNADPKAKYSYELVGSTTSASPTSRCRSRPRRRRQLDHRRRHPLLLGSGHGDGRYLSHVRPAGGRLGRGAARHHLCATNIAEVHRVNGTMINQNEVAAKFMTGLKFKKWVVIHDTTDYGKGHNQYFSEVR